MKLIMSEENELKVPLDIPWKLVSTTQVLQEGSPDETTISLFMYESMEDNIREHYPNERVFYVKFTVTINPIRLDPVGSTISELALDYLQNYLPVIHATLDIGVSPRPFREGVMRPYFHTAAPIRRSVIETGVFGSRLLEGEENIVSIGKSNSQIHKSTVGNIGSNIGTINGLFYIPDNPDPNVQLTSNSSQYQEMMNRSSSEERRELLSHTTNIENVISLLNAKHIGSPFLSFSLFPRPVRKLGRDQTDPYLWYHQFLERRSSGLEGIQEFFAVLMIPRNSDFCIDARLRRFAVVDDTPLPPLAAVSPAKIRAEVEAIDDPSKPQHNPNLPKYLRSYLMHKYPPGTPISDLDINVEGDVQHSLENGLPPEELKDVDVGRAVVNGWGVNPSYVLLVSLTRRKFISSQPDLVPINYKLSTEVYLEALNNQYLKDLERSPLERGSVVLREDNLQTCFAGISGNDTTIRSEHSSQYKKLKFESNIHLESTNDNLTQEPNYDTCVTKWNLLQNQLSYEAHIESNIEPISLDGKFINAFLRIWSKLKEDDPKNVSLEELSSLLKIDDPDILRKLRENNIDTLKSFASLLITEDKGEKVVKVNVTPNEQTKTQTTNTKIKVEDIREILSEAEKTKLFNLIAKSLQEEEKEGVKQSSEQKSSSR